MIVCADDFGLREDIDEAILELCASGKLSAVSCMAALARCDRALFDRLRAHESRLDIGLHLCFTDERQPLSRTSAGSAYALPSFVTLVWRSLSRQVSSEATGLQVADQYDAFLEKAGREPDFIDGHLHAHQLPGVRQGLLQFLRGLPTRRRSYVRNTLARVGNLRQRRLPWLKAGGISALGAGMKSALVAAQVPTNDGFAGIYNFKNWRLYPRYFPKFISCLHQPNGILVTHPGLTEDWRKSEFETLRSSSLSVGSLNRFRR